MVIVISKIIKRCMYKGEVSHLHRPRVPIIPEITNGDIRCPSSPLSLDQAAIHRHTQNLMFGKRSILYILFCNLLFSPITTSWASFQVKRYQSNIFLKIAVCHKYFQYFLLVKIDFVGEIDTEATGLYPTSPPPGAAFQRVYKVGRLRQSRYIF